ncbi:ribonuclease kappa-B [Ditylenchus destructor]|nr:ribonuclease kappa-B [Ditylenchus destructor]
MLGLKSSAFIAVLSLWGVIFMIILGALFKNESVGLLEDLPELEREELTWDQRKSKIQELYSAQAVNCWIVGGAYAVVFIASALRLTICLR